jgi:hypothetical protein
MKRSFGKLSAATVAVLVLASFVMTPFADAAGGRGGGGGGGGGGARASGGGGGGGGGARAGAAAQGGGGGAARQNAQVNNAKADARTNNVRSTSVNNVNNVNVERNVNVSGSNNCCNNGWDNDYHPVATAAAVTATAAVIGSMVRSVPAGCVPVNYGGVVYQQCGSTWYAPQGSQFAVVSPPY